MVVTFFVVLGGGLTVKERLFVTLAWLPKATVQVSIDVTPPDAKMTPRFARGCCRPHWRPLSCCSAECWLSCRSTLGRKYVRV